MSFLERVRKLSDQFERGLMTESEYKDELYLLLQESM